MNLSQLKNLGPKSCQMLYEAGIDSETELRKLGAVKSVLAVTRSGHKPSLNLLWAIEGALKDIHWSQLSAAEKENLKRDLRELGSDWPQT